MRGESKVGANLRISLVVPHVFMHRELLPQVIFSPGQLAISLADELARLGHSVTLYTPGPVDTIARNITADLSLFEQELATRGDSYLALLKKHPYTFTTLARQVQSEVIAQAYADANANRTDVVHIYSNEEEMALPFAKLCTKPVIFSHHDPYNFLVKYRSIFPKYPRLNWVSFSLAQQQAMPPETNWIGNVYHGISDPALHPVPKPASDYFLYLGRIIEPKGVHLAIQATKLYNEQSDVTSPVPLRIAGKHYAASEKRSYWHEQIEPELGANVIYEGFAASASEKQALLANARCLIVPSVFDEPFGMVCIEALACGTPVVALDSGALPEVIDHQRTGLITRKQYDSDDKLDTESTARLLANDLHEIENIDRQTCHRVYEQRFTLRTMTEHYIGCYRRVMSTDG